MPTGEKGSVTPSMDRRTCLKTVGAVAVGGGAATGTASGATTPSVEVDRHTVDHTWTTVGVGSSYSDPVAIALPPSENGYHPCSTRVRDVSGGGFELALEEWRYLDGWHATEVVGGLVGDRGVHTFADGTVLELGRVSTDTDWTAFRFEASFSTTPVVLAVTQTRNGFHPVVARLRNVSDAGAEVALQEEEAEGDHKAEDVGYLAVEPGSGEVDGRTYEASLDRIGSSWTKLSFENEYEEPVFLADLQSFDGPDTASIRYRNLTNTGVEVRIEEERSDDDEAWHTDERVGYLIVERGATDPAGYGLGGYGAGGYGQ